MMAHNVPRTTGMVAEMRVPTRAAPRPPTTNQVSHQGNVSWNRNNDPFGDNFNAQFVAEKKKAPPPRPPPPKFKLNGQDKKEQKPKKPARPTELLTFVQRIGRKSKSQQQHQQPRANFLPPGGASGNVGPDTGVCLIDLSPPGSPTFTTRWSSDAVSIDSFGSDGNSNPSATLTSSSSNSQTDSAFDDDFDQFAAARSDPWTIFDNNHDPFSPRPTPTKIDAAANSFAAECAAFPSKKASTAAISMPTIIRAKPSACRAPSTTKTNDTRQTIDLKQKVTPVESFWQDGESNSPPMPTVPPPPPPEYLTDLEDGLTENVDYPHGIVLYDLQATQPGDLELRQGDLVVLTNVVNDDWMEGRIGSRVGIFPSNFVDIKIPLPGTKNNIVTALYAFPGETNDDLSFPEGARITVLSQISDDWLYGEYNGQKGQFPANYVDRIPRGLSNHFQ